MLTQQVEIDSSSCSIQSDTQSDIPNKSKSKLQSFKTNISLNIVK